MDWLSLLDTLAFRLLGGTLFAHPDLLTMKEIHLDTGALKGKQVIVEGSVDEVSEHGTYLVLTDTSARLLVVLTDLEQGGSMVRGGNKQLRVLGTIESGKKGLPYVMARSLNVTESR